MNLNMQVASSGMHKTDRGMATRLRYQGMNPLKAASHGQCCSIADSRRRCKSLVAFSVPVHFMILNDDKAAVMAVKMANIKSPRFATKTNRRRTISPFYTFTH